MQVVVDSLLINYSKSGSGKNCVLLIHGWGDSLVTFAQLEKALAADFTVINIDLPGFGNSQVPHETWGLDEYGVFIKRFLKKIGVKRLLAVVGHSNGGALAIRSVARGYIAPDRLVLIAAAGVRSTGGAKKLIIKLIAKTGKVALFWLPKKYRNVLQKKLYGAVGSDMLVVPHMKETFKVTVKQDVQGDARVIKQPTLLMYGTKDKATPVKMGTMYKDLIEHSHLEIIEAGHNIHREKAELVQKNIKEFLC